MFPTFPYASMQPSALLQAAGIQRSRWQSVMAYFDLNDSAGVDNVARLQKLLEVVQGQQQLAQHRVPLAKDEIAKATYKGYISSLGMMETNLILKLEKITKGFFEPQCSVSAPLPERSLTESWDSMPILVCPSTAPSRYASYEHNSRGSLECDATGDSNDGIIYIKCSR